MIYDSILIYSVKFINKIKLIDQMKGNQTKKENIFKAQNQLQPQSKQKIIKDNKLQTTTIYTQDTSVKSEQAYSKEIKLQNLQKKQKNPKQLGQQNYHKKLDQIEITLTGNKQSHIQINNGSQIQDSQKQTISDSLSWIDFEKIYENKNKYKDLDKIHNRILDKIQCGALGISNQRRLLKLQPKQNYQSNQIEKQQKRLNSIAQKKFLMMEELSQLYKQEAEVRLERKNRNLLKKVNHQSVVKTQHVLSPSPLNNSKLKKKLKRFNTQSKDIKIKQSIQQYQIHKHKLRSYFTQQQKKRIYEILKNKDQKKHQFESRVKQLVQSIQKQKKQSIQNKIGNLQIQKQKRKLRILEKHKLRQMQKSKFIKQRSNAKKFKTQSSEGPHKDQFGKTIQIQNNNSSFQNRFYRSPKRTYIFQQFHEQDLSKQKQRLKNQQLILLKKREAMRFDFSTLKNHIKSYKTMKELRSEDQKQKIQTYKKQQKQRLKTIREKYGFLTKIKQIILQEQKQSIQKYQKQLNKKLHYQNKIKDYSLSIKKDSPKRNLQQSKNQIQFRTKSSLSHQNLCQGLTQSNSNFQKNNIFLQQSRNNMKKRRKSHFLTRQNQESKSINKNIDSPVSSKRYKNYLAEIRNSEAEQPERKEQAMMKILKKQDSSMAQIKKALQIFNSMNNTYWKELSTKTKQRHNIGKVIKNSQNSMRSNENRSQNHDIDSKKILQKQLKNNRSNY